MQLIDFANDQQFQRLKKQMGAPDVAWEMLSWNAIDTDEIDRGLKRGIEVDYDDIEVNQKNNTLEYKGRKVLVYIRDQYVNYTRQNMEYKFHISDCDTITTANASQRASRYVVSTRTDGMFRVNLINRRAGASEIIERNQYSVMNVCKNCLRHLNYKGYGKKPYGEKKNVYDKFKLEEFFATYGGTINANLPEHTDITAPLNQYSQNFSKFSKQIREKRNYQCEKCTLDLRKNSEFLHVHHRNADKSDNSESNLQCLCVSCHADMPEHGHMKNSPAYARFKERYGPKQDKQKQTIGRRVIVKLGDKMKSLGT